MAANQFAQAVRQQLGIGRVLPLGGPEDGAWITEHAAAEALRTAVGSRAGVQLGTLRLALANPEEAAEPTVPAPPSALPPGPLRITADFTADLATATARPLPTLADELRTALLTASERELGLVVGPVDLRVSGLVEPEEVGEAPVSPAAEATAPPPSAATPPPEDRTGSTEAGAAGAAAAALSVPGVARLAPALGGLSRPVRLTEGHALIQLATASGHRALDVATAVRAAVTAALPAPLTVAVLVTAVEQTAPAAADG